MQIAETIQATIHKLEVGGGQRYLRYVLLALIVLLVGLRYDFHAYKNIDSPEGMDSAQLARNISEGNGYTTQFVRPLSLYLIQKHNQGNGISGTNAADFARIKTAHPDIANPPVYPVILAGLMKILPFHYAVQLGKNFWSNDGHFAIYQPDFLIAIFNQILLLAIVAMTFFIARKLFDSSVAWLSVILVFGCNLLWRFSDSGLSTMLLLLIFLALAWCILKIEERSREPQPHFKSLLGWAIAAGIFVGLGALTRYAFGWLIIPTALFLIFFSGQRRVMHTLAALGAFLILLGPWIIRNCVVSGTPFGTAGYAVMEGTFIFPQFQLERSIHPDFNNAAMLSPYFLKLFDGVRDIFDNGLPRLGGSWASMFFLAGLLLRFRNVAVRRARYFLLMCLGMFIIIQSLGQTQLSVISPDVNSENLLVLLAPLIFIYGVSLFFTLLDQMNLPLPELRYIVMSIFVILCCLPMIFALAPFRSSPIAYPPYYPPDIQQVGDWMDKNELMMSDLPWAVAWYGDRQCVWLTDNSQDDFAAINHNLKPVNGIYFTTETLDKKFLSEMARSETGTWERFILNVGTQNKFPPGFYLQTVKILTSGIFVTDHQRWPQE